MKTLPRFRHAGLCLSKPTFLFSASWSVNRFWLARTVLKINAYSQLFSFLDLYYRISFIYVLRQRVCNYYKIPLTLTEVIGIDITCLPHTHCLVNDDRKKFNSKCPFTWSSYMSSHGYLISQLYRHLTQVVDVFPKFKGQ